MTNNLFRIRLWAIIGPPNSGKSSVIGSLTSQIGRGSGGKRDVLLRGGGWLRINAFRQSIQEAGKRPEKISDEVISDALAQQQKAHFAYYNLLLALRSDRVRGLPSADVYLSHFVKKRWDIQSLVLLGSDDYDRYANFGAPLANICDSTELIEKPLRRNCVFGQVRNHFDWA